MIGSRASEYGMQTLLYLQQQSRDTFVSIHEIAEYCELSSTYLAKVTHQLVDHGLLASQKGVGGGVRLAKPARDICLIDVVAAIDGLGTFSRCVLGYSECSDAVDCPMHATWGPLRETIVETLTDKNLEELAGEAHACPELRQRAMRRKSKH